MVLIRDLRYLYSLRAVADELNLDDATRERIAADLLARGQVMPVGQDWFVNGRDLVMWLEDQR